MSDDLISRKALFNELFVRNGKVCPNHDIDNFPVRFNVKDIKQTIRNAPTAYDMGKVIQNITELQLKIKDKLLSVGDEEYAVMLRGQLRGIADCLEIIKSGGAAND